MAVLLKVMGHEVEFAINGFTAIDIARRFRPDVILLDIGLPDYRSDKLAGALKWECKAYGPEDARSTADEGLSEKYGEDRLVAHRHGHSGRAREVERVIGREANQ